LKVSKIQVEYFSFTAYNHFSICIDIGCGNNDIKQLIENLGRSIIFDYHILIDYGIPFPVNTNIKDDIFYTAAKNYSLLSNRRASSCRQALLALIRVCKGSKFPRFAGESCCVLQNKCGA
jgi:hypothetical protein